jgi:carbonic anhydrase
MKKLINGIVEFRQKYHAHYLENFSHLALGQFPDTLFIACSDSRVVPNLFASTNPGDLFVIRNIGNMIPPFSISSRCLGTAEAAAIEFSLMNLTISNIIVCGHSECAAMKAMASGMENITDPFLKTWLSHYDTQIDPAKSALQFDVEMSLHNKIAQINVLQQMYHIQEYPIVKKKLEEKALQIHGWYFDVGQGDVYGYEKDVEKFILIDEEEAARILQRLDNLGH